MNYAADAPKVSQAQVCADAPLYGQRDVGDSHVPGVPMDSYPAIEDHGLIGDLQTAALVTNDGIIDWFCAIRRSRAGKFDAGLVTPQTAKARAGSQPVPGSDDHVWAGSADCLGISIAATNPISEIATIASVAVANGLPPGELAATSNEPASAVPSDDPRLDTLRDTPEISP